MLEVLQFELCDLQVPTRLLKLCFELCLGCIVQEVSRITASVRGLALTFGRKRRSLPLLVIRLQLCFDPASHLGGRGSAELGRDDPDPGRLANDEFRIPVDAKMGLSTERKSAIEYGASSFCSLTPLQ